jgi:tetrahedral aminopeptidase
VTPMIDRLRELSNAPGISGDETAVRRALRPMLEGHVDELRVDAMGNLIARKAAVPGRSQGRVMIAAHMDEVGLMVTGYSGDGTLRVETVGGIPSRVLPGATVLVGKESMPGVIGLQAIHRTDRSANNKAPTISKLAVDIGAANKEEAERVAPLGTSVVFATRFTNLGHHCMGKAFDDRAGCAALVELLRGERFPFEIYGVFTVQEEVGLRGAQVAAYAVEPDFGIALEGTLADDLPKGELDVSPITRLGKGPAITIMDRSYTTPPFLLSHFIRTAEMAALPHQFKEPGIGGTDAGGIHRTRAGVPSITIAVPCRYIHSPVAVLCEADLTGVVALVDAAVRRLTPELLRR